MPRQLFAPCKYLYEHGGHVIEGQRLRQARHGDAPQNGIAQAGRRRVAGVGRRPQQLWQRPRPPQHRLRGGTYTQNRIKTRLSFVK